LTGPVLCADWAPREYQELPVFSVRTAQELAKFARLRFQLLPELDKTVWGMQLPKLSAKMVVGSSMVQSSLTGELRGKNRVIWERYVQVLLLAQMHLETVCYAPSVKTTGCFGKIWFGIRCTTCGWCCTVELEADLEFSNKFGSAVGFEAIPPVDQTLAGMLSLEDFRAKFFALAGDHLTDEMHNRQWQMYGANLSAGMGYLQGR